MALLANRDSRDLAGRDLDVHDDSLAVVSLLPRDDDHRYHLRTLGAVLANPETALEIRRAASTAGEGPRLPGLPPTGGPFGQLLDPELRWDRVEPVTFLRHRMQALSEELRARFGQVIAEGTQI